MKKWLLLAFIPFCWSCFSDSSPDGTLAGERLIRNYFNKYQRDDLNKLLDFFDSAICNAHPSADVLTCYESYLSELANTPSFADFSFVIPPHQQDSLFQSFHPATLKDIWSEGEESAHGEFGLKYDGRYHRFLVALGEEHHKIKQYATVLTQAGKITPSLKADVLLHYKEYDLSDQRVRLMLALHYLTLNKEQTILTSNKEENPVNNPQE